MLVRTSLPLSRVIRWSRVGSGISSAVTIHGPKPPVAWKFLPAAIERLNWMSRIEPSLSYFKPDLLGCFRGVCTSRFARLLGQGDAGATASRY
jgi:hypothetical protein